MATWLRSLTLHKFRAVTVSSYVLLEKSTLRAQHDVEGNECDGNVLIGDVP